MSDVNKIITITISYFLTLHLVGCKQESNAMEIVLNSLEAHGGIDKWRGVKEISYQKTTILFDSLGVVEKKGVQKHKNTFQPDFTGEISWQEDSIQKLVLFKNGKTEVFYNDMLQNDSSLEEKYHKNIMAAHYVIWQPYKLLDVDAHLHFVGQEQINGTLANVVKAIYFGEDGLPANTWWYYFDAKTYKLIGNMVHHGETYSYIKNIKYETKTGLSLNAERKSYRVDSLRNIKFLKAQYFYKILSLKE